MKFSKIPINPCTNFTWPKEISTTRSIFPNKQVHSQLNRHLFTFPILIWHLTFPLYFQLFQVLRRKLEINDAKALRAEIRNSWEHLRLMSWVRHREKKRERLIIFTANTRKLRTNKQERTWLCAYMWLVRLYVLHGIGDQSSVSNTRGFGPSCLILPHFQSYQLFPRETVKGVSF